MSKSVPSEGQIFPSFSLPAVFPSGDKSQEKVLSDTDFKGSPWVLFVYPKDATSGCTIEVCEFREMYAEFEKLNVKVVGLSRDKMSAHHKFIANQNLPYPLISDAEQTFLRSSNLIIQSTMYGKPVTKVLRVTFVMDAENKIIKTFENVAPLGHAAEVLATLESLK
ncbi:MAG: peroxiredoxin [Abditibacteriaceae bacterium]